MALITRPNRGFIHWPVSNGDSTTIILTSDVTIQVDLHHMQCAEDPANPSAAVIDELEAILPKRNGRPYLSLFVLTHPDRDHCKGFADLLKRVSIGEIWHTPRIFREYHRDLCDDAKAFKVEMRRRRKLAIERNGNLESGDRIRVIGWDEDVLGHDNYNGFPRSLISAPGNTLTAFDGDDHAGVFRAFLHGPFKDECDSDRNDTSVAMQVTLTRGSVEGKLLLLGDYAYENVRRVFSTTKDKNNLAWDVFLSPHHCSKKAIHDKQDNPQRDILKMIEDAGRQNGRIIASSRPVPSRNNSGDDPPHVIAKNRYQEIVPYGGAFVCTQEHPNREQPRPVVFEVTTAGVEYVAPQVQKTQDQAHRPGLAAAVEQARGTAQPPATRVGFGSGKD